MDVSLSQIQRYREMWLDRRLHRFFSWTVLILAGRQFLMLARHWESRLGVLPSHSHTHLDGKCVLAKWQKLVTEIWSTVEKKQTFLQQRDIRQNSKSNATDSNHKLLFWIYLICTWINTFFPPQDYKHCSFFFLFVNNIGFVQIFTWLILENQVPLKCNILKHNRGRLTERPTRTYPKRADLVDASIESLPSDHRQRKIDWQARQSSAREWQQGNRHKNTHTLSSLQDSRNKKSQPTRSIQRAPTESKTLHITSTEYYSWGDSIWF